MVSPSPETERLFIAVKLPAPIREILAATAIPIAGVNWTPREQLHLTLRFLGDLPTDQIERLIARFVSVHVEPFVIPIEGVGTFPPNRPPRVLWAGTGSGHPQLFQLRQRVDDAVLSLGLNIDVRTFHPHVTLARCHEDANPAWRHWLHNQREFAGGAFRVEAFDLYASELRPEGAIHTLRQRFPLGESRCAVELRTP